MSHRVLPSLFCLVGPTDDLTVLADLAAAGVRGFQVRAKDRPDREVVELTRHVRGQVEGHGALVVVNDRVDLALAADAAGVHLGAEDLPVADARRIAPHLLVGATCRDRAQVIAAREAGADYAGLGPVFATASVAGLPEPLGPKSVRRAAGVLPLVAIGGVTAPRAAEVRAAGADSLAVIGAIWRQPDPVGAAKELLDVIA